MRSEVDGPILLVEHDRACAERLARLLAADGFRVELARSATHARVLAAESSPRVALLGALPAPRGTLALLEEIRSCPTAEGGWDRQLPAVVLGKGAPPELDALRAFEAGADDFLPAPAGYLELRARLRALLRRATQLGNGEQTLAVRGLLIDTAARQASLRGQPLELRRMEYELLAHLAAEPHRVFTRRELLRDLWGYRAGAVTRTLDSHASRLRHKLQARDGGAWLPGVRGVGYRLI